MPAPGSELTAIYRVNDGKTIATPPLWRGFFWATDPQVNRPRSVQTNGARLRATFGCRLSRGHRDYPNPQVPQNPLRLAPFKNRRHHQVGPEKHISTAVGQAIQRGHGGADEPVARLAARAHHHGEQECRLRPLPEIMVTERRRESGVDNTGQTWLSSRRRRARKLTRDGTHRERVCVSQANVVTLVS